MYMILIQVNVWEEEISQLKIEIETLEENHQDEIKRLRLELSKQDEQEEASGPISLGDKRKVLENSWMKVVESRRQSSFDKDASQEARRLQELKNYIQKECDQLLQRRDRLQQEVGWIQLGIWTVFHKYRHFLATKDPSVSTICQPRPMLLQKISVNREKS